MDAAVEYAVCPMASDIVPNVSRLASVAAPCCPDQNTVDGRYVYQLSNPHAMLTPASRQRRIAAMSEGTKGQELWPERDVRPEDEIVRKYRFRRSFL